MYYRDKKTYKVWKVSCIERIFNKKINISLEDEDHKTIIVSKKQFLKNYIYLGETWGTYAK